MLGSARETMTAIILFCTLVVVGLCPAVGASAAMSVNLTATQYVPIDISIENPSYSDNPFDLVATATFAHSPSGETRTTEMFYAGGNTWKIRFVGTLPGVWTATTSSSDPDLDGLSGAITVEPAAADATGFITHQGNRWARQKGPDGTPQAIVPQFVMYPDPDYYYNRPDRVDADIQTYLFQHGFNGFHTRVYCRWFDLNKPTHDLFSDMNPNPDFRTFEALELLINKAHAAGGLVHLWAWGDNSRKQTQTKWGINGTVDRRLQRYIAARLGPLLNWTMGYGYDLPEWVNTEQLCSWHSHMHQHFGWPHGLGGRGPTNQYTQICETLDYSSYEFLKPSYQKYAEAIEVRPNKPTFMEDRFRVFSTGPPSDPRDYTEEETRRGLYHSTMAGGVANIWGYLVGSSGNWSVPYPNPHWSRTYADFFKDRLRLDMIRDNAITNGVCLRTPDNRRFLFYFENKNSCWVNLDSMPSGSQAFAVDAKQHYSEINLGTIPPGQHTWTAPYTSDWAIAVGNFHDDEPPSVPTNVAAAAQSETSVLVTWTASTDNVGVTGYKVFRNGTLAGTSTTTSYTNTGLSAGTTYSYTLSAYDAEGNESAQSSPPVTVTTPDNTAPSVPTNVAATAQSETSVNVTWTASTDNVGVTGYRVYRNGTLAGTSTSASYTDTGLSAGTAYSYRMSAYDAAGNNSAQSSPPATVTTPDNTAPSVPTNVAAAAQSETTVLVTWTASTDNVGVTGYKVFRNGTQVGTPSTTSYTDTGLSAGTTYSYRASARDAAGNNSAQSSPPATATTPDNTAPSVPTGLTAAAQSGTSILLTWTASTDNVGVTGYRVYRNGVQVGTSGATSYTDVDLLSSTTYTYRVSARDAAGNESAQSSPVTETTYDIIAPSVPTDLEATALTPKVVKLTWTASTDDVGVTGYKVFRNAVQVGTLDTASYTDAGLAPGTPYTYAVSAYDAAGNDSAQSDPSVVATLAATDIGAAKLLADSATVGLVSNRVSVILNDSFYIQEEGRNIGIKVVPLELVGGLTVGCLVDVGGVMNTDVNGERYVLGHVVPN